MFKAEEHKWGYAYKYNNGIVYVAYCQNHLLGDTTHFIFGDRSCGEFETRALLRSPENDLVPRAEVEELREALKVARLALYGMDDETVKARRLIDKALGDQA